MAKVLVIDDEPNVRTLLDILLRSQGYDVILADNGLDGPTALSPRTPRCHCA